MRNPMFSFLALTALFTVSAASASNGKALATAHGIAHPAVIAHRGASYDAPESTTPAYLLARDQGADYLELDLQRSSDGVLVVVHDDVLSRTSDVAERFPERKDSPVSAFTLAELKSLDAGSWFNQAYPARARSSPWTRSSTSPKATPSGTPGCTSRPRSPSSSRVSSRT